MIPSERSDHLSPNEFQPSKSTSQTPTVKWNLPKKPNYLLMITQISFKSIQCLSMTLASDRLFAVFWSEWRSFFFSSRLSCVCRLFWLECECIYAASVRTHSFWRAFVWLYVHIAAYSNEKHHSNSVLMCFFYWICCCCYCWQPHDDKNIWCEKEKKRTNFTHINTTNTRALNMCVSAFHSLINSYQCIDSKM